MLCFVYAQLLLCFVFVHLLLYFVFLYTPFVMFCYICYFRKTHKRNFIFVHVNMNSYRHKFAPTQELLRGRFVDLLIISESKLDESFPNSQFDVEGYTIHRQDKSASSGGLIL